MSDNNKDNFTNMYYTEDKKIKEDKKIIEEKKIKENKKNEKNEEQNVEFWKKFIPTKEFEVNCFCQIRGKRKSNYFFAGGFDKDKRQGLIKLYRITCGKEIDIEFLDDIYFDDDESKGFEGTINCIIQSPNDEKILVTCWDKKIYSFSKPNIDYYLDEEDSNF